MRKEHDLDSFQTQFHDHTVVATTTILVEQKLQVSCIDNDGSEHVESGELKKLDSFGR